MAASDSAPPAPAAVPAAAPAAAAPGAATVPAAAAASAPIAPGGSDPENHPFFHYYGQLVHQQNMLQDAVRTGTYHKAFISNPADFRGKVVVDVGTGSGILAFFAAKAGARKVYAIEASGVASQARKLMEANGLADKVEVIKGKVRCASETGGAGGSSLRVGTASARPRPAVGAPACLRALCASVAAPAAHGPVL